YATFTGTSSGDSFGNVSAGNLDIDGDGSSDLLVGAPNVRSAGTDAGMVYVFTAPGTGSYRAADATLAIPGEDPGDLLGTSLLAVPDQDGDQQDELLVGAPSWRNQGRVYMVYGGNLL
ncbi:MAG TPA: FG-GAP repeat protein, partial [Myxococcota bacterium]|nr:FG-GAP repeat protein [Myxococcota bacterium]